MNGPRCIGASRGPTSSLLRRVSGTHQFNLKIGKRVAFALRSCGYVQIFGGATRLAAAVHLNLRRDLAVEQGRWLVPVASCSSPRVVRRTCVRIRCLSFDHTIGRQYPRSGEPNAPLPRQVQRCKCCGRYGQVSSCDGEPAREFWCLALPAMVNWCSFTARRGRLRFNSHT